MSSPSHGKNETTPSNSKNNLPTEPDSIPVVGDINIKESSTAAVIKSEVEKVSKDEKTSVTISASSANPLLSSASTSISLTASSSSTSNSITNTLPPSTAAAGNNDKSVVIGDKRFVLPKRSAHSRRVIKPNKRFLDDSVVAAAALSVSRKSLASSSGNKSNRKLVVTVDSIKDNNGSLIENHKTHKIQQQLLSAAVSVSATTTISSSVLCAAAVSPKGAAGSTTDVVDDSSHLKGSNKDEDSVGSCSKHTTITSSNGKNKCDIKSGGDGGEADYNSDNLKGNLKRTDKEDKGSECEKNKKSIEETQSGRCSFCHTFFY